MVSLPHPTYVRHDGPRLMHPLLDWNGVAQLMRVAFQSEVTSGSLPLLPDWFWLRGLQPVFGLFEWLGMETPEQMLGYVWEERSHLVGNVTLGLSHDHARAWLLSNVAVHPSYRRRGIARALIELAIAQTRRHGGRHLLLQVQSDNVAARALYESLGFRTQERLSEFYGAQVRTSAIGAHPLDITQPTPAQWSRVQSLASAHLPLSLRGFRHSLAGLFQISPQRNLLARVTDLLRGVQYAHWCLLQDARVVGGMIAYAQLGWSSHRVGVCMAPEVYGQAEPLLLAHAVQTLRAYPSQRTTFVVPMQHGEMRSVLQQAGLREVRALDLMGLAL